MTERRNRRTRAARLQGHDLSGRPACAARPTAHRTGAETSDPNKGVDVDGGVRVRPKRLHRPGELPRTSHHDCSQRRIVVAADLAVRKVGDVEVGHRRPLRDRGDARAASRLACPAAPSRPLRGGGPHPRPRACRAWRTPSGCRSRSPWRSRGAGPRAAGQRGQGSPGGSGRAARVAADCRSREIWVARPDGVRPEAPAAWDGRRGRRGAGAAPSRVVLPRAPPGREFSDAPRSHRAGDQRRRGSLSRL